MNWIKGKFRQITENYGYRIEEKHKKGNLYAVVYHKDRIYPKHEIAICHDAYRANDLCIKLEEELCMRQ